MNTFNYRAFTHAKDPEHQDQDQDAYAVSPERGVAVIADGVSSAIFSAAWAKILTQNVLAQLPDPDDQAAFSQWLILRRRQWDTGVNTENLAWYQKPKLATGAFSTLLWLKIEPCGFPDNDWPGEKYTLDPKKPCYWLSASAIGDSCLFHLRRGRPDFGRFDGTDLIHVFPLDHSQQFEASPTVLGSVDLGRDAMIEFRHLGIIVQEGDLVVLATDAVSQWALRAYEAGNSPEWENFWQMSEAQWRDMIDAHRQRGDMRYDDATLVMMQIGTPVAPAELPVRDNDFYSEAEPEAEIYVEEEEYARPQALPPRSETPASPKPPASPESPKKTEQRTEPPKPRPGFRYSLASGKGASGEETKKDTPPTLPDAPQEPGLPQKPADSWVEKSAEIGNRVTEGLDSLRQRGAQAAESLGEKISDGMSSVGEITHQWVDAAKPRIHGMFQGVMGLFRKDKADSSTEDDDTERDRRENREAALRRAEQRKADPNRRRFYTPKDTRDGENGEKNTDTKD